MLRGHTAAVHNRRRLVAAPLVALSVLGTACAPNGPSEADAHAMVESMLADPLQQPLPGSKVAKTWKDFCGGGSVAPSVERRFTGNSTGVEAIYRRRMLQYGWHDVRDVPAGGIGATKGDRGVSVVVGGGAWYVSMQQGTEPADCEAGSKHEEVTTP
jgi:hypothetical protein